MPLCAFCQTPFEWQRKPGQAGRAKIYCSRRCSGRARYVAKPRPPRGPADAKLRAQLSAAGRERWARTSPEERSEQMRTAALARYTPEQVAAEATRKASLVERANVPCPYCGDPVGRAGRVKCAKPECNLKHNAARMRPHLAKRRAALRGVECEDFDPREVFDRDGWICGICELGVDPLAEWPDPGSVSLDHIQPLALGGSHTRENTQCSHLYCNTCKGARLTA